MVSLGITPAPLSMKKEAACVRDFPRRHALSLTIKSCLCSSNRIRANVVLLTSRNNRLNAQLMIQRAISRHRSTQKHSLAFSMRGEIPLRMRTRVHATESIDLARARGGNGHECKGFQQPVDA